MEKKQKRKKSWPLRILQGKQVRLPRNMERKRSLRETRLSREKLGPESSEGTDGKNIS